MINFILSILHALVHVHVKCTCDILLFFLFSAFPSPFSLFSSSFFSSSLSPQVVDLNFLSVTTPEILLKTFDHYCEYKRTPNGVVMAPAQLGKWLVLFCDEINVPGLDKYGEREGEKDGSWKGRGEGEIRQKNDTEKRRQGEWGKN